MKKFTKEARFECNLDEIVKGKLWAFTPGNHVGGVVRLGIAIANEAGYNPIPLHWCNAETYDEMWAHCDELNEAEGHTKGAAMRIISSTHAAQQPKWNGVLPAERKIITRIIDDAFLNGWSISVYDGEETTVTRSRDKKQIIEALNTTGEDTLTFYGPDVNAQDGKRIGFCYMIYNNGNAGKDLVSDHTDNDELNELLNAIQDWVDSDEFDETT